MSIGNLDEGFLLKNAVIFQGTEAEIVRKEGMHAVDGNKLLRKRVGHPEVILFRAWDAADDLAIIDAPKNFIDLLTCQSPPVGMHANVQRGSIENGRCPVDRVDLCHEGHVDEPGMVKQIIV